MMEYLPAFIMLGVAVFAYAAAKFLERRNK